MDDQHLEILRQSIDAQQDLNKQLASLTVTVKQMNGTLGELNSHFSNGFRQELKEHVSEEIATVNEKLIPLISPSFFIKLGLMGIAVVGSIVGIVAFLLTNNITP